MFYQGKKIYLPVSGKNTNLRSSKRKGLPIKRPQKIRETPLRVAVDILDNGHAPKFRFGDRVYCDPEARPRKGDDVLIVLRIGYPKAATLARDMGAQIVIPCHYEMFEFNTASPDEFIATAEHLQQPYKVLFAGEHWDSSTLN